MGCFVQPNTIFGAGPQERVKLKCHTILFKIFLIGICTHISFHQWVMLSSNTLPSKASAKQDSSYKDGCRHPRQPDDDVLVQVHYNDDGGQGYRLLELPNGA